MESEQNSSIGTAPQQESVFPLMWLWQWNAPDGVESKTELISGEEPPAPALLEVFQTLWPAQVAQRLTTVTYTAIF